MEAPGPSESKERTPAFAMVAMVVLLTALSVAHAQSQQVKLVASESEDGDYVGSSLAAGEGCVFASSPAHPPGLGEWMGAVFLFRDISPLGDWSEVQDMTIAPAGLEPGDHFGESISLDGRVLAASAYGDDDALEDAGCVYVIRDMSAAGNWSLVSEHKIVPSDASSGMMWYGSISIKDRTIVAGAPNDDEYGSVYVFKDTSASGDWSTYLEVKIGASDGYFYQYFGHRVWVGGDRIFAVGVYSDDSFGEDSGAVYIYRDTSAQNDWSSFQEVKLAGSDTDAGDQFGMSLVLVDRTLVVGAPAMYLNFDQSGAVLVFRDTSPLGDWSVYEETLLLPPDPYDGLRFGRSVATAGREILVGVPYHDGAGEDAGAAYSFADTSSAGDWSEYTVEMIVAFDANASDAFGAEVVLTPGSKVVSAPSDINQNGATGCAYVLLGAVMFSDGFEAGDTSAWSATVP